MQYLAILEAELEKVLRTYGWQDPSGFQTALRTALEVGGGGAGGGCEEGLRVRRGESAKELLELLACAVSSFVGLLLSPGEAASAVGEDTGSILALGELGALLAAVAGSVAVETASAPSVPSFAWDEGRAAASWWARASAATMAS